MNQPARGYTWPPFEPGNQVARRHGARGADVPEVAAPRAAELQQVAPWLAVPAFAGAATDVAIAEVMVARLLAAIDEDGVVDADGNVRSVVAQLDRYLARLSRLRHEAGCTPLGLGQLLERLAKVEGSTAAQDALDALKEAGRAVRAEAEARRLPAAPGPESGDGDEADEVTP